MNSPSSMNIIVPSCFFPLGRRFFVKFCYFSLILISISGLVLLKFGGIDQSFNSINVVKINPENVAQHLQNQIKNHTLEQKTPLEIIPKETTTDSPQIGNKDKNNTEQNEMEKNQTDQRLNNTNTMTIPDALAEINRTLNNYYYQTQTQMKREQKTIFILTNWRSGSSFFGEAISQHPSIFYHYEPIMYNTYRHLESGSDFQKVLSTLKSLRDCRYENASEYLSYINDFGSFLPPRNPKINAQCTVLGKSCSTAEFLNPACEMFPIHLFKFVRLRGRAGRKLLTEFNDPSSNSSTKIIYLVRDPRGIWASRLQVEWCTNHTICSAIKNLCQSLNSDLKEIKYIESKHPSQVQVVRYEDVVWDPVPSFREIFKKLGVSWAWEIERYLRDHTDAKKSEKDTMSTFKFSRERARSWQRELKWADVEELQTKCGNYMIEMGYPFFNSRNFNKTDQHF